MSKKYINTENLSISENLYDFINNEALAGTGLSKDNFWKGLSKVSHELTPKNKELLNIRKKIQIIPWRCHLSAIQPAGMAQTPNATKPGIA